MSPATRRLIVLGLIAGLFCWIFAEVLFQDRNVIYRDAGHFYYPLLKLVQDEWRAGRWSLWNPHENGGMPLLANPACAVLYPPRVVFFQWLPISYATAYKWYILAHILLSAATAYAMARCWNASEFASGLAAISYAFGAVVLFQYSNVIFLVGAAWVPLGFLAADRALDAGDFRWATVLGIVLALQMLGGDPEAAYVTGGFAALYLLMLDVPFAATLGVGLAIATLCKEFVALLRAGLTIAALGKQGLKLVSAEQICVVGLAVLTLGVSALVLWRSCTGARRVPPSPQTRSLQKRRRCCLFVAAVAAVGLSAVQWIPTWEFSRLSNRAVEGAHHDPYAFSIAPWRLMEMVWPNISGHQFPINTRWLDIFDIRDRIWEPSLYSGVLPLLLALSAWRIRRTLHRQRWLSVILVVSTWAAFGPAGGISWYVSLTKEWKSNQVAAAEDESPDQSVDAPAKPVQKTGPSLEVPPGGLYWLMVQMLPGFRTFRFPAKLLTYSAVALAALAAIGWDRLFDKSDSRTVRILVSVALASCALALIALLSMTRLINWFDHSWLAEGSPYYGPLQAAQAAWCILRAFLCTGIILSVAIGLAYLIRRRNASEGIASVILALVVVDIGLANRWLVASAPQSRIEAVPQVVKILEEAEAAERTGIGDPQPFRVHRVSLWSPIRWVKRVSPDQDQEIHRWEKDTIQPKYGLLQFGNSGRVNYTINEGTLEPYDYWWFFAPFYSNTTRAPKSVVYYPRRSFDMWGAKYFVLPKVAVPSVEHRGITTFLPFTELVAESAGEEDDFQVRRNLAYYPRAWIVHRVIPREPIHGLSRSDRMQRMREILYAGNDGLWSEPEFEGRVQDPRRVAWIEHTDFDFVASLHAPAADPEADRCKIVRYEPDRVEIEAETAAPGVLVLADVFFPGWKLTVDGEPTPILRANRMMRGVPLRPGKHHVVFAYQPLSFRLGGIISLVSLAAISIALMFFVTRRQVQPGIEKGRRWYRRH